jgi:hypothetical protein
LCCKQVLYNASYLFLSRTNHSQGAITKPRMTAPEIESIFHGMLTGYLAMSIRFSAWTYYASPFLFFFYKCIHSRCRYYASPTHTKCVRTMHSNMKKVVWEDHMQCGKKTKKEEERVVKSEVYTISRVEVQDKYLIPNSFISPIHSTCIYHI